MRKNQSRDDRTRNRFEVLVGNIGHVFCGTHRESLNVFSEYRRQSRERYGRASGEEVTLLRDGEPISSYVPR